MKRKREGTLVEYTFCDELPRAKRVAKQVGISGLDDFLTKADALATNMEMRGELSIKSAQRLRRDVKRLREAIAQDADPSLLYAAVGAGLAYARLKKEVDDDADVDRRTRITRRLYFEMKRKCGTDAATARALGVTPEALRKWRKRNLE